MPDTVVEPPPQGRNGRWRDLPFWCRAAGTLLTGGASALAFAPYHLLPLAFVGYAVLVLALEAERRGSRALLLGWLFGFGQFVVGLNWIGNALLVDAERFAWLMPLAVAGVPAGLAILPALAIWAAWWLTPAGGAGRIVALALCWSAGEVLRAHLFTGFPWNLLGYVWAACEPVLQAAALVGVYGLGLLACFAAAAPAALLTAPPRQAAALLGLAAAVVAGFWGWGSWRLAQADGPADTGLRLRLVQPAIPQREKWRRELLERNVGLLESLSRGDGGPFDLLVWPETAPPFLLGENAPRRRQVAALLPARALLLSGSVRIAADDSFYNSLLAIDAGAEVLASYDKHHLVPFGEYLPLRWLLGRLGLGRIVESRGDFSSGAGPRVLHLPGLPPLQPLICYEAIFPDEVGVPERPAWLLTVTNDAWFGDSAGPYQHFEMARVRAIEQGLPLVRAANNGISGVVDAHGRVRARLDLNRRGYLDAVLPGALAEPTPYARLGMAGLLPLLFGLLALLAVRPRRRPA